MNPTTTMLRTSMTSAPRVMISAVILLVSVVAISAQPLPEAWPQLAAGKARDLSAKAFLGFELGSRYVTPAQANSYAAHIARLSDRVQYRVLGETVTGRPLALVTVSAPKNLSTSAQASRRQVIAEVMKGEGAPIPSSHPIGAWFCMSIHGDEGSGVEAGLKVLEWLATDDSPKAQKIRDNVVLFIEVVANPDGRSRFVQSVMDRAGAQSSEESLDQRSYSQTQPWPGGRTNHYLFDLNRDWFLQTQRESQARIPAVLREMPQVLADFHEMQTDRSYYFSTPPSEPINQHTSAQVREQWKRLGAALRHRFDENAWPYWTGEVFPADYPGYGGAWPTHLGMAGMTFEQASPASGTVRRKDGSILTLREAMERHAGAGMAVLELCADQRETMLQTFSEHFVEQRKAAAKDPKPIIVLSPSQAGFRLSRLASLLRRNGIEVEQLMGEFTCKAEALAVPGATSATESDLTFPAGTLLVSTRQPLRPLILTLLDPKITLDPALVEAERQRHKAQQESEIYDVASWNLPLLFGVDAYRIQDSDAMRRGPIANPPLATSAARTEGGKPPVAWALSTSGPSQFRQLIELLRAGVKLRLAPQRFEVGNRSFTAGTVVALKDRNRAKQAITALEGLAKKGALIPLFTSRTESGQALGSGRMISLRLPKILLLIGEGTNAYSAGANWWFLDRILGIPHRRAELGSRFDEMLLECDVLILPSGSYLKSERGGLPLEGLQAFLKRGGRILASEGALSALGKERLGLLGIERDLERSLKNSSFPGPIVSIEKSDSRWLWSGLGNRKHIPLQMRGRAVFRPTKKAGATVLAKVADAVAESPLSGIMLPHHLESSHAMGVIFHQQQGRGDILAFREDPTFRGTAPIWWQVFVNALVTDPSP